MKKLIFSAMLLSLAAFFSVNVNAKTVTEPVYVIQNDDETPVKPEDLPKAVKDTLATETYANWKVESAVLVKGEKEYYKIELVSGEEKQTVKLDSEGKLVE